MTNQYRFEDSKLFKYYPEHNAFIYVGSYPGYKKKQAIDEFEQMDCYLDDLELFWNL